MTWKFYYLEDTAYDRKDDYLSINCSIIDYNGAKIGKAKERIIICQRQSFAGLSRQKSLYFLYIHESSCRMVLAPKTD